jgi:hypothetical protein
MKLVGDLLAELIGMFVGDRRLTVGVLAIVAVAGLSIDVAGLDPLVGGSVLLLGCPLLLIDNVRRSAGPR